MPIQTKRAPIKETVGAHYLCFATMDENFQYDKTYETTVIKTEVVKNVSVSENSEATTVMGSGKAYEVVSSTSSTEISIEVIAFPSEELAKMRGDIVDPSGLVITSSSPKKPYFAYGKTVIMRDGSLRFDWYPKCQLTANTDESATKEDGGFSEQNDTFTIKAMPFDDNQNICTKVFGDFNFPENLTEDKFFSKPILTPEDLTSVMGE